MSAIGRQTQTKKPRFAGGDDQGGGPDGSPFTPPKSFKSATGSPGGVGNYFPTTQGQCSSNLGSNVKVNVNCLNVSDSDLQGRGQANNEESIARDPNNTRHIVASDNNYIRGDGTCGAHYSLDGGKTWADATVPNGFTRGDPFGTAREYWQTGGDTSLAWDSRGKSGAVLEDKALTTVDTNARSPFRDRIYVTWTEFAADGSAYIYEVHSDDYGQTFSARTLVSKDSPTCTNTYGLLHQQGLQREQRVRARRSLHG